MNVYVWRRVGNLTDNWHTEGGILVVGASLDDARKSLATYLGSDHENCEAFTIEPDVVIPAGRGAQQTIVVFPDAGCC